MSEREDAIVLANRILDRVNYDPDDDLAVLSRQLLRTHERADAALARVGELQAVLGEIIGTTDGFYTVAMPRALREAARQAIRPEHPPAQDGGGDV